MNTKEFIKYLNDLKINVNEDILNKLTIYTNYLIEYNTHTNLTSITEYEDIYLKHYFDSLTLSTVIDLTKVNTLLDIGTGAGFPGLIIAIFYPNIKVTLLDSNHKKTLFLNNLINKLNLNNVTIINDRVENITKDYLNYFDVVTSRAVANMCILTELALPLVKLDKYFIALKGKNTLELNEASYAIEKMHGKLITIKNLFLPFDAGERNIVKIKKIKNTNIKELRTYEKIIKKPLKKNGK